MGEEKTIKKSYLSVLFFFLFTFPGKLLNSHWKTFTNKLEIKRVILKTEFLKKKTKNQFFFACYGKCNYCVITLSNHVAMTDSPTTGVQETFERLVK